MSSNAFAQDQTNMNFNNDPYTKEWKAIQELDQKRLPKSALEKVEGLYKKAKKDNNPAQVVKTTIYRLKYYKELEEDGYIKVLNKLEVEAENADFPIKSILHSMLGEMYHSYLQQNYWRLSERTSTPEYKSDDIATWTLEQLIASGTLHYECSVDDNRLPKVAIEDFRVIFTGEVNTQKLRPSLYDFLVHRAIDHFMNEQSYLTEPSYKFYVKGESFFYDAGDFTNHKFTSADTGSQKLRTIHLFQDLLSKHIKDRAPAALIDADLKRLKFVYNQSVSEFKEDWYLAALARMEQKYPGNEAVSEILFAQSEVYYKKGRNYDPVSSPDEQWELKKAWELCQKGLKLYPKSYGARLCMQRVSQIEHKRFDVNIEEVNLPDKPALISIRYKNTPQVFVKVVRLDEDDLSKWGTMNNNTIVSFLNKKEVVQRWDQQLPDEGDFQFHRTEIRSEPLPTGLYALIVADNATFKAGDEMVAYLNFTVSEIGYFYKKNMGNNLDIVVANRETGAPMPGVKVEYFKNEYNRKERRHKRVKIGEDISDGNGFVKPAFKENEYFVIRLSKGGDVLLPNDSYSLNYRKRGSDKKHEITRFFLDRAIYRPGQTIYFKALVLEKDEKEIPRVLSNKKVNITLQDVNWQEVEKLELTTNEYGTIHGSFVAPQFGLRGNMGILSDVGGNRHSFRVEEYKRPKFEVEMKASEESVNLGDKVVAKGEAIAYAGNAIDGATVKYRVVRQARFPWWPWWYRRPMPSTGQMEIANGTVKTAADGSFEIEFEALADLSIAKDQKPSFKFTVYADVVDITGETHSAQRSYNLAYLSLQASINVPKNVQREKEISFGISTTNLDGNFIPARGKIEIYRLEEPGKAFVSRYWDKPDKPLLNIHKFKRLFPNFAYGNEDEMQQWPQTEKKFVASFNTENSKALQVDMNAWETGSYVVVLQTKDDKSGELVEDKRFFSLYDLNTNVVPSTDIFWVAPSKEKFSPDENAELNIGTGFGPVHYLMDVEHRIQKGSDVRWGKTDNLSNQKIKLSADDKGGLICHLAYMKYNRAYSKQQLISVPWDDKELKITYATFRDKLKPGQEEEWQIKISGPEGDRVAAEVLAGMYDASLDAFAVNRWHADLFPNFSYSYSNWRFSTFGNKYAGTRFNNPYSIQQRVYPLLNWFDFHNAYYGGIVLMENISVRSSERVMMKSDAMADAGAPPPPPMAEAGQLVEYSTFDPQVGGSLDGVPTVDDSGGEAPVKVRTNLDETVFFMPQLKTDAEGNVVISFTMNEALTKWKFMTFAHTTDLKTAIGTKEIVTQKELMVQPNPPRFFREGDEIYYTAKVSNLTENTLAGTAKLELFDATTMQPVDILLGNNNKEVSFEALAGQSAPLSWKLNIPKGKVMAITHRVTARAGSFSDGEESALPVLTNRMLVTETMPMNVRGGKKKTFDFSQLDKAARSSTLQNHKLSLEFTSNPAWYAVKALPYMMEYPYDCTEQIFSRFYANSLASTVANKYPKIRSVFDQWKDTPALESELSKNQELKSILLEETPWVLQAQDEAQQRKNIALLFDLNKMAHEKEAALAKLKERQSPAGGFAWFPGGRDSRYITQYLVEGMGHLQHLGAEDFKNDRGVQQMLERAIVFIDEELQQEYAELQKEVKKGRTTLAKDHLSNMAIHYLYTRSFFEKEMDEELTKIADYYLGQAEKYWTERGLYQQGLIALALERNNRSKTAKGLVASFRERALQHDELGMYWKYDNGYFWYQLPIETHSLMVEVFADVAKDDKAVDELKVWLLKNKETTHWKTTKATANAVYALLANGSNWLVEDKPLKISLPKAKEKEVAIRKAMASAEAGSGYFQASWEGKEVNPRMGVVKVENQNEVVAWGSMYWQYFEELDKIDIFEDTPLQLKKQLFRVEHSDKGPVLLPIDDEKGLQPGDKVKVRIELKVDRAMEYVHMKDMRASGFEPINVLSSYKWQGGLGYYESTGDAATNFFFSYLPKGTYVFEYPLRVIHKGDFSNGITTIQCMYAPQYTSHSEGVRVTVD
jgi:uncharacterized protein YfaS (alpha-2-macroglobulin family)